MKLFSAVVATALWMGAAYAAPTSLKQKVEDRLTQLKAKGYALTEVANADVGHVFPSTPLVLVRFRQYPIGFQPPAPLKVNNLFFEEAGALAQVSDIESLKKFFARKLGPVRSESGAKQALRAWLNLSEELETDGFFGFAATPIQVFPGGATLTVTGGATVLPKNGDKGDLQAKLAFGIKGNLLSIGHTAKLRAGVRPICQATKLLDADPVVRGMAEQALLTLGSDAKGYLDFIRPTLSPALQGAVDKLWKRIVAEGR